MNTEFLKNFQKRMKHMGMYMCVIKNTIDAKRLKNLGYVDNEEQITIVMAVMLFIMEKSLKDEYCTIDEISEYIDDINTRFFHNGSGYEQSREIADIIVNQLLGNNGSPMYFKCYNFDSHKYENQYISYIANRAVTIQSDMNSGMNTGGVRRTGYYMTEDGYSLMLSTLEIEDNMKFTVQEIIFKMHLEKADYDKAVDSIKEIFLSIKVQLKKIEDTIDRIKQNPLNYSIADYKKLINENLSMIEDLKKKFDRHEELVSARMRELEDKNINIHRLDKKERENLNNLRIIERYLSRTVDSYQSIINAHFDFKVAYDEQLYAITQMTLIKRFNLKNDLYMKVLEDASLLEKIENFTNPLFNREIDKTYNINKSMEIQRPIRKKIVEDEEEELSFDEEEWEKHRKEQLKMKLDKYRRLTEVILSYTFTEGYMDLRELMNRINDDERECLLPSVSLFKEVIIEMLRTGNIDIVKIREIRREYIYEEPTEFNVVEMVYEILKDTCVKYFEAGRIEDDSKIEITDVYDDENNCLRNVVCSNIYFKVEV